MVPIATRDSLRPSAAAPSNLAGVSEFSNESVVAIENTLNNVDRALERLRVGTYRTCQACGTEIDQAELLKNPLLANCPAHPELS
jgi:RNA polymerase-binding transcription factor DksA